MKKLNADKLKRIVDRLVEVSNPEKIVLFGSASRGTMHQHSDLDFLVIKHVSERRAEIRRILGSLHGFGIGVDITVFTPDQIEFLRDCPPLL